MKNNDPLVVMYVEDDADIREVVELAFALETEIQLTCCAPTMQTLAQMKALKPDLVLLDVMMPDIDGVSLAKQMRADTQLTHTPFAFVTAKAMPRELEQFKELGAVGVISKPFDVLQLAGEVRALLALNASMPANKL